MSEHSPPFFSSYLHLNMHVSSDPLHFGCNALRYLSELHSPYLFQHTRALPTNGQVVCRGQYGRQEPDGFDTAPSSDATTDISYFHAAGPPFGEYPGEATRALLRFSATDAQAGTSKTYSSVRTLTTRQTPVVLHPNMFGPNG